MANPTIHYDGPIVTRSEAKRNSAKRYFTGKACRAGHIAQWDVASRDCSVCSKERSKKWRADNPEKARNSSIRGGRKYYAKNIEEERARGKRYREKNRDKDRARHQEKYLRNKEHYAAYGRRYHAEHPWIVREKNHRRRARENGAGGSFTEKEAAELFERQRSRCAICRKKLKFEMAHRDHVIPVAKGGHSFITNIQITCPSCNKSKGAMDPIDFARQMGRLI